MARNEVVKRMWEIVKERKLEVFICVRISSVVWSPFVSVQLLYRSRFMGKPTICIGENKGAHQLTAKLISTIVFANRIVQFLLYVNPKFQASGLLLWLYSPVRVGPDRKPHCWFAHETAHRIRTLE